MLVSSSADRGVKFCHEVDLFSVVPSSYFWPRHATGQLASSF